MFAEKIEHVEVFRLDLEFLLNKLSLEVLLHVLRAVGIISRIGLDRLSHFLSDIFGDLG
jgi:hypothetical protein